MTRTDGPGAEWDSHLLLLYRDEAHRQDSVALWVQRGLDRGEKIFYTQLSGDTALLSGLALRGVDVVEAARRGQFAVLPLTEFFPSGGQAALVREALAEGYPGVRLSARADAALDYLTEEEYEASDRTLDELCASLPVSAMCQYDSRRASERELITVILSHPDAIRTGQMRVARRADSVSVAGEVDLGPAEALLLLLHRATHQVGPATLVIDLSELTFLDVAGCRALVAGTRSFRAVGGSVVLRGVNRDIRKVMILLEIDRLPGVELE